MTSLIKFPIDQAFKSRLQRNGFDIDDPERRYPTRNGFPQKILDLRGRKHADKAQLLLNDRAGPGRSARSRILPWLAAGLGGASWPDLAMAHDHHPQPLETAPIAEVASPQILQFSWFDVLGQIDLSDPIWGLSLGAALLLTQTVAVFQRRALLRTGTAPRALQIQPDLFPETLPDPRSAPEPIRPPSSWHWQVDAQTRIGQVRSENQDALATFQNADDHAVLIVCDGAGGVGGGREASQSAMKTIKSHLTNVDHQIGIDDLQVSIEAARQASQEEDLEGVTTALVVALDGDMMHYATLGDGAVTVIWPDGMIGQVQIPHHTAGQPSNVIDAYIGGGCNVPPRTGSLRLEPGCIVMVMSDGVSDLITFEDFADRREDLGDIDGLSESVLQQLEDARDPDSGGWLHSDNMTLAIARLEAV